ncbi:MAG: hypothetical protein V4732_02730 [Pseudomonadota bacterium]
MGVLQMLGLSPSKSDYKLRELVKNSYDSVQVVGRGTVKIDPNEVSSSEQFKKASVLAKAIVSRNKR